MKTKVILNDENEMFPNDGSPMNIIGSKEIVITNCILNNNIVVVQLGLTAQTLIESKEPYSISTAGVDTVLFVGDNIEDEVSFEFEIK